MTPRTSRALIVDDHQFLAQSVAIALSLVGLPCVVAELTDLDSLIRSVTEAPPALVLLDLDLGGAMGDGAALVRPIASTGCAVLIVTGTTDEDAIARALEQGAVGLIRKGAPLQHLLSVALAAARGEQVMSASERRELIAHARARRAERLRALVPFGTLTVKEARVLHALVDGESVSTMANRWVVSEATVRSQVHAVLSKLAVRSQVEAVSAAHRSGWVRESRLER